jgi:preprotein translocase subunit YajC
MFENLLLFAQNTANTTQDSPPIWFQFAPIILIVAVFYFLLILPARRREKQHRDNVLNVLKKNDKVVTNSGIIGTVANISASGDEVTLRLEEGRMRVLKSTIARILGPEEAAKDQPQATDERIKK